MTYIITIRTAVGARTYPAIGDLGAIIAGLGDDVLGMTFMLQP